MKVVIQELKQAIYIAIIKNAKVLINIFFYIQKIVAKYTQCYSPSKTNNYFYKKKDK